MRLSISKKNLITLIASVLLIILSAIAYLHRPAQSIDLNTYENFLKNDLFTHARIAGNRVYLDTDEGHYTIIRAGIDIEKLLHKVPVDIEDDVDYSDAIFVFLFLISILLFAIFFGKKKEQLKEEKTDTINREFVPEEQLLGQVRKMTPASSTVTFADVAGIESVKEELFEVVDFLKNSKKYHDFGIKMPRGVLLVGPPGVGKTLIAKAVAGEAGVPFFYQSGASFVQIYVGMGAKRVRELFLNAKRYAPSIIFIDEIDAVGKARGGGRNDEREATLNQLLTEMDGFEDNTNVIVIAATNKIEMLDEALLRSGRFDRRVFVSLPSIQEREAIIKVHLEDKKRDLDIKEIAKMTVGFSGAALSTLVNEAAIHALRLHKEMITLEDFGAVKEKVLLGKKKILSYSEEEKNIQAGYQAAKALCAYWYEVDFDKVTMINDFLKEVEKEIASRTQMLSKLKVYLSGYVFSALQYDEVYTNCAQDIKKAKMIADEMVQVYAMGEGVYPAPIDSATLVDEAIEEVEAFLHKMQKSVKRISEMLIEKESISKEELGEVVREFL